MQNPKPILFYFIIIYLPSFINSDFTMFSASKIGNGELGGSESSKIKTLLSLTRKRNEEMSFRMLLSRSNTFQCELPDYCYNYRLTDMQSLHFTSFYFIFYLLHQRRGKSIWAHNGWMSNSLIHGHGSPWINFVFFLIFLLLLYLRYPIRDAIYNVFTIPVIVHIIAINKYVLICMQCGVPI